jgi:hypothetical protein
MERGGRDLLEVIISHAPKQNDENHKHVQSKWPVA